MNKSWLHLEYITKGVTVAFLGLLAAAAPDWGRTALFCVIVVLSLAAFLGWAGWNAVRQGCRVRGRWTSFLLYLLLENPFAVYSGMLAGLTIAAAVQVFWFGLWRGLEVPLALAAGVGLGVGFVLLRQLANRWARTGTVLLAAAGTTATAIYLLQRYTPYLTSDEGVLFAGHLLLAIPFLYLLTFSGRAEETEMEIGAICAALGICLWILLPESALLMAALLPLALYIVYTQRILQHLRVFKHVLRGMNYAGLGMYKQSLRAYQRALQLDPNNRFAREGRWRVHRQIDFDRAAADPELMALIDLDLCLDRAAELLLKAGPSEEQLAEAAKLLDLVAAQRPSMAAAVAYWRAVAHTHAREYDRAEEKLRRLLDDSQWPADDVYRESVLPACWQLILLQSAELKCRLGDALLAEPGRRLDAIAATEKALADRPDDATAWELKKLLYNGLTFAEYADAAGREGRLATDRFDHNYCGRLGMSLLGDAERWQRGLEYLRIAALGFPDRAPSIYCQVAETMRNAGAIDEARHYWEMAKQAGRGLGVKTLTADEQQSYFAAVRELADDAFRRGDLDAAIENFSLYLESKDAGLDTVRLLTELYERKGDALGALLMNEKALVFDGRNQLFLERKDRYYYSVTPADLLQRPDAVKKLFDVNYCLSKAKSLLDLKTGGPDQVAWASHLAELACAVQPDSIRALALAARAKLRQGDEADAMPLLEQVKAAKPEQFANADEADAWYWANARLGDIYLKSLGKPDLALACYSEYRKYARSGADTLFKMGQAYEMLGDRVKAAKCYENVKVYDHPLASEANRALLRLESSE